MPFKNPNLRDDEAWDVAAYVNSMPRPQKSGLEADYPDRKKKPIDAPYPPYSDTFSVEIHKFGPFQQLTEGK